VTRCRHGLEVEDEGPLKDLVVIFDLFGLLCIVRFFVMPVSYSQKTKREMYIDTH
jgi:hypothetical protein